MHTARLEDSQNLVTCAEIDQQSCSNSKSLRTLTSDDLDLSDTMAISEDDTDLRWSSTLSCEFADVVDHGLWGALEPGRNRSRVWDGGGADTLSLAVKTTHVCGLWWLSRNLFVDAFVRSIRNFDETVGIQSAADFDAKTKSWRSLSHQDGNFFQS